MIEITHKQAQRLIREGLDRALPDEQWAILQAHLESCPDCRAYSERARHTERGLRHALRGRWISIHGPRSVPEESVKARFAARAARRRFLRNAAPYLGVLLLVILFVSYREFTRPAATPAPTASELLSTLESGTALAATPTAVMEFNGLVVIETRRDGNAEIYLVGRSPAGPELTNLTQNPAEDTAPAWSPDGEWIAFLSDRDEGKNELYVVHVAGSRLTRLTASPEIYWQGPLDWSADGSQITLVGRRGGPAAPAQRYLVALNAAETPPLSLAFTSGTLPLARFSPQQAALAYETPLHPGSLTVANTRTGWSARLTREDNEQFHLADGLDGAYDWTLGGRSLVYVAVNEDARRPAGANGRSEIRISAEMTAVSPENITGAGAEVIDAVDSPLTFRAVTWVPRSLMAAALVGPFSSDANQPCWLVRLTNAYNRTQRPRNLQGLCVEGALDRSHWTEDGQWLVLLARPQDPPGPQGYYALRLPTLSGSQDGGRSDFPGGAGDGVYSELLLALEEDGEPAEPRVRPAGRALNINPTAAAAASAATGEPEVTAEAATTTPPPASVEATPAATETAADGEGWIVYQALSDAALPVGSGALPAGSGALPVGSGALPAGSGALPAGSGALPRSYIARVRPDGSERQALTGEFGVSTCPRISPDGSQIAFLGHPEGGAANQLLRMSIDGADPLALTPPAADGTRFACPVWSPDGQSLAAVLMAENANWLVVAPADGKTPPRWLKLPVALTAAAPLWAPAVEGRLSGMILLVSPTSNQSARLLAVDPAQAAEISVADAAAGAETLQGAPTAEMQVALPLTGWDEAVEMSLSPQGYRLALLLVYAGRSSTQGVSPSIAQLRVFDTSTLVLLGAEGLQNFDDYLPGLGSLGWLPDDMLGFVQNLALIGPHKTSFTRFDTATAAGAQRMSELRAFEDVVTRAAWQGSRVAFGAETGLWLADWTDPQSAPVLLSDEVVVDLDW